MSDAGRLAAYIRGLADFEMVEDLHVPYAHMGATIVDAVLRAGQALKRLLILRGPGRAVVARSLGGHDSPPFVVCEQHDN